MSQEALAECLDRRLDARVQAFEGARPLVTSGYYPALEPAFGGMLGLDARLVADEPQEREVRIDLALHHRFQVELNVRLARERRVVAETAKLESVADETPQIV